MKELVEMRRAWEATIEQRSSGSGGLRLGSSARLFVALAVVGVCVVAIDLFSAAMHRRGYMLALDHFEAEVARKRMRGVEPDVAGILEALRDDDEGDPWR